MEKQTLYRGKNILYKVEGKGDVLVLLHGFMENLNMWDQHSKELSKNYKVICIDLPGHGKSDTYSENHGMIFTADAVKTVLNEEQVENCIMIGHSMGGYITLAFAEKYPEMMNGLGLFHSQSLADTPDARKNRDRMIELVKNEKIGFINQFIPSLFAENNVSKYQNEIDSLIESANNMNPKGIIAAINGMKERNMRLDVLAFAEYPVLFILGKQDTRIAFDQVLAQAATPQLSQITILGNSGHMGWLEESSKTILAIEGFLKLCLA